MIDYLITTGEKREVKCDWAGVVGTSSVIRDSHKALICCIPACLFITLTGELGLNEWLIILPNYIGQSIWSRPPPTVSCRLTVSELQTPRALPAAFSARLSSDGQWCKDALMLVPWRRRDQEFSEEGPLLDNGQALVILQTMPLLQLLYWSYYSTASLNDVFTLLWKGRGKGSRLYQRKRCPSQP